MTPCDDCGQHHFGSECDGTPSYLIDDDDHEPECPLCGDPRCESERVCATCRRDAAQLARDVVMPALAWCREKLGRTSGPSITTRRAPGSEGDRVEAPETSGVQLAAGRVGTGVLQLYSAVETVGTLAALGLALGSLAPLAAMLGGWS